MAKTSGFLVTVQAFINADPNDPKAISEAAKKAKQVDDGELTDLADFDYVRSKVMRFMQSRPKSFDDADTNT